MYAKLVNFLNFILYFNLNYLLITIFYFILFLDLYSNNGQVIITCMLDNQAKQLITLDHFQIDVSFKRVKGEINEFEINSYDSQHHLSKCKFLFK